MSEIASKHTAVMQPCQRSTTTKTSSGLEHQAHFLEQLYNDFDFGSTMSG